MGNIIGIKKNSKKCPVLNSEITRTLEYDQERKSNIFPNTFTIFKKNLNEKEFFERLNYVSRFAEIYFYEESKVIQEITAALNEIYTDFVESKVIEPSFDVISVCLMRAKWLELNWQVFQLYY